MNEGNILFGQEVAGPYGYDLMEDLAPVLERLTSGVESATGKDPVVSVTPVDDKNFDIKLSNGKVLRATKTSRWRSWWNFEYEGQKYDTTHGSDATILAQAIQQSYKLSTVQNFELLVKGHDWWYEMSDDQRAWAAGSANLAKIQELYRNMSDPEQIQAQKVWDKYAPAEFKGALK